MKVYCKCLNIEIELDTVDTNPKKFEELATENDEFPPKGDHEFFCNPVHSVSLNSCNDTNVLQDDIVSRRTRSDFKEKPGSFQIHAYLPKLVLTHHCGRWMIRECFLCHSPIMAFFTNGSLVICPNNLIGMCPDDGLHKAQTSTSSRFWMLSRSALAKDNEVDDKIRFSSQAKKQLESMSSIWHIAKMRAKEEMHRKIEELKRQEEAAFEELLRVFSELQGQVANSYLSLLTLRHNNPAAYVNEEKEKSEKGAEESLERLAERMLLDGSQPAGDHPDNRRQPFFNALPVRPLSHGDVEMATDALDFSEADLFEDVRSSPPLHDADDDAAVGRIMAEDDADKFDGEECLSTSAISSSMKAGRGMRATSRQIDDRLPDTNAFNAMTDAERAYAIERASYHCQDHRLHELYGDIEPPHLQDLRRQAERARQRLPSDEFDEDPSDLQDKPQRSETRHS